MRERLISDASDTSDTFFRKSYKKHALGKVPKVASDASNVSGDPHGPERVSSILPRVLAHVNEPKPTVVVDTREQTPLDIEAYPVVVQTLPVGDYGIRGFSDWTCPRFVCERKNLSDLVGSLTRDRERFWRECEKLRQFGFAALLIEAQRGEVEMHTYRSAATPQSILASLDALSVRHGLHVFWAADHTGAARHVSPKRLLKRARNEHERLTFTKAGAGGRGPTDDTLRC